MITKEYYSKKFLPLHRIKKKREYFKRISLIFFLTP